MPGHRSSTIIGGTRHSASKMTPVPTVTVAPSATPATMTSAIAVNQVRISLARVMFLSMILTRVVVNDELYRLASVLRTL
jgi:hypothetical protein